MIEPEIFLQAMASVSAGVFITDEHGKIIFINDALNRKTHCAAGEEITVLCERLQGENPDPNLMRRLSGAILNGEAFAEEIESHEINHPPAWSDISLTPMRGSNGAVRHFIGTVRDITDRKAFETRLIELEGHYRFVLDNALAAIVVHKATTEIVYSNRLAEQLLGLNQDEMLGAMNTDPRWRFVREDGTPLPLEQFPVNRAVATRAVVNNIILGNRRIGDGQTDWFLCNAYPVLDAAGDVTEVVVTFSDVSQLKTVQIELERAKAAAEAASIAKATFLSNMSHEIRTPLTAIVGFSGLLADDMDLTAGARRNVQRIKDGAQMLMALVNNILDFSRLEAGQFILDPHPFNPVELVEATTHLLAPQAAAKKLTLAVAVGPNIPDLVEADSARLKQVLLNLLTNSIKFTESGHISVRMEYDGPDQKLKTQVADTGCGIPANRTEDIFQRFSQVDAAINRKYGGSGLGLAICKELVELMGGQISLESHIGAGSTFTFTITAPATRAAPAPLDALDAPPSHEIERALKILVIDDVPQNRELVRTMLEAVGHTIHEAEDGVQGVRAALAASYDVILMDVQMPGMDGLEATQVIRASPGLNQKTPILALSANVLDPQLADCRSAGMNDHIAKPISPREMLSKIALWTNTA